jgi:6-pyruvoyltetrahydropterin/6-carboxytetrahydropterin synthase
MYQVSVEKDFDAAHYLRNYQGKCENIHGHRFKVVAHLQADRLNGIGLAYDFTKLKKHLGDILAKYDHTCLNDIPPFDKINPSSENLAETIFQLLNPLLPQEVALLKTEVWESPQSCAVFIP